ncbi:MAG TPA: alpha-L-fucosidase [Acidimicrobiia bacterium]|jgi:alpha-L-fucosidase
MTERARRGGDTKRGQVRAVKRHTAPTWWRDAKLGIFVHWTPASVPAFAPTEEEVGELLAADRADALAHISYTEWYENSLRFPDSPAARHHRATYGNREYRTFAQDWEAALEQWNPDAWADHFAAAGARYVVLVSKHMDGYCLWPSSVANPNAPKFRSSRDVVGELGEAVRARGLKFGLYYSGGLDATWNDHPIGRMSDLALAQPRGAYVDYAEAQVRELIARYRPSVLWGDISWPGPVAQLARLLEHYYRAVPDGAVNDRFMPWSPAWAAMRWGPARGVLDRAAARSARRGTGVIPPAPPLYDYRTPEYTVFDDIQRQPWECVRGIDKSFGYNAESQESDRVSERELLWMLTDIVSKNGNLLLNVGPRGVDAQIAPEQLARLEWLGAFTATNEAALRGTRPWATPAGRDGGGVELRYTARDRFVYAIARAADPAVAVEHITLEEVGATPTTEVRALDGTAVEWHPAGSGGGIELRPGAPIAGDRPVAFEIRDAVAVDSGVSRSSYG